MPPPGATKRIGTNVTIDEIPDRFKEYRIIGKGYTSVVLEETDVSIIVLTRDPVKNEWLAKASLANYFGSYSALNTGINNYTFRQDPVKAWSMPKLYDLAGKTKTKIRKIIKNFTNFDDKYTMTSTEKMMVIEDWVKELDLKFSRASELSEFKRFVIGTDKKSMDFYLRQNRFMQNAYGEVVITDPLIVKEFVDLVKRNKRSKNPVSRLSYDRGLIATASQRIADFIGAKHAKV